MTKPQPAAVIDPRPWWRRAANSTWLAAMYFTLGMGYVVTATVTRDHAGWIIGPVWVIGGVMWLIRPRPALRDGVVRVAERWFRRREIAVADIEAFSLPHPFDTATTPTAVLTSGEGVRLADVDEALVRSWADATGIPVVRDPKPSAGTRPTPR